MSRNHFFVFFFKLLFTLSVLSCFSFCFISHLFGSCLYMGR
jgi:hypothetical protein